jgi:hypothetical protein
MIGVYLSSERIAVGQSRAIRSRSETLHSMEPDRLVSRTNGRNSRGVYEITSIQRYHALRNRHRRHGHPLRRRAAGYPDQFPSSGRLGVGGRHRLTRGGYTHEELPRALRGVTALNICPGPAVSTERVFTPRFPRIGNFFI